MNKALQALGRPAYNAAYNKGFRHSSNAMNPSLDNNPFPPTEDSPEYDAWEDGYLDAAAGRDRYHLRDCTDHDACG